VTVPERVMQRLADAGDRFTGESIDITVETLLKLKSKRESVEYI
jgi:hypothetical protein